MQKIYKSMSELQVRKIDLSNNYMVQDTAPTARYLALSQ